MPTLSKELPKKEYKSDTLKEEKKKKAIILYSHFLLHFEEHNLLCDHAPA